MDGERNLQNLLRGLSPEMRDDTFVFCTIEGASYGDFLSAEPLASFLEEEGLTLILAKETAEDFNLKYEGVFKCITLKVHSGLAAVGLTAAVSGKLAGYGISANIIAAYFHDHIFVPAEKADLALSVLKDISLKE